MVRLIGIEPTLSAPEADALSTELQAQMRYKLFYIICRAVVKKFLRYFFTEADCAIYMVPGRRFPKKFLNFVLLKLANNVII